MTNYTQSCIDIATLLMPMKDFGEDGVESGKVANNTILK